MALHGSCAATGGDGVLFLGPSGSGKSELVLRLMNLGWLLVADDQVEVVAEDGALLAHPPEALRGMLELRGVGLFEGLPVAAPVRLRLVVDLMPPGETPPRLPEPRAFTALGQALPRLFLAGHEAAAPDKVVLALEAACGRARQRAGAFAA